MLVSESDLTTAARIRNAALESFATRGVAATTIRAVAEAAGTSPGLLQHHFRTKARLREAVDGYVGRVVAEAFADVDALRLEDPLRELGDRVTNLVRTQPNTLLYVARSVADGDERALALFESFVGIARAQCLRLAAAGRLRPDLDVEWAAVHIVIFNLASLLFHDAIARHFGGGFRDPDVIERWNTATRELYRRGIYANG